MGAPRLLQDLAGITGNQSPIKSPVLKCLVADNCAWRPEGCIMGVSCSRRRLRSIANGAKSHGLGTRRDGLKLTNLAGRPFSCDVGFPWTIIYVNRNDIQ